jgi:hypothetical protein
MGGGSGRRPDKTLVRGASCSHWRAYWRAGVVRSAFCLQISLLVRRFLNRVRKFDSCRRHLAWLSEKLPVCRYFSLDPGIPNPPLKSGQDRLKAAFTGAKLARSGAAGT